MIATIDKNIGINGDNQMALYAKMNNPLRFADRHELTELLDNNVEDYKAAREEYERIDRGYQSTTKKLSLFHVLKHTCTYFCSMRTMIV